MVRSPLKTYNIVLTRFSIQDSQRNVWFFEETFLLANTSMEVVLKILFFSLSNADIEFAEEKKLTWRFYTVIKALLPTTSRVELIDKKEFIKAALDKNSKTFVMHVTALEAMPI